MFNSENILHKWLLEVNKIVIVGVRFNDYDHELISSLSNNFSYKKYDLVVVNRVTSAKDQKQKVAKVAGLFSSSPADISFIDSECV